jgi:hypothetical protein
MQTAARILIFNANRVPFGQILIRGRNGDHFRIVARDELGGARVDDLPPGFARGTPMCRTAEGGGTCRVCEALAALTPIHRVGQRA